MGKSKTKNACIADVDATMRIRLDSVPSTKITKITLLQKNKFIEPLQFGTLGFFAMPQAFKIPGAKASVEKYGQNGRKYCNGS